MRASPSAYPALPGRDGAQVGKETKRVSVLLLKNTHPVTGGNMAAELLFLQRKPERPTDCCISVFHWNMGRLSIRMALQEQAGFHLLLHSVSNFCHACKLVRRAGKVSPVICPLHLIYACIMETLFQAAH